MKAISKKIKTAGVLITVVAVICVALSSCTQQNKIIEGVFPNTVAENATIPDKYKDVANEMTDFTIKEFTETISKIPRKSGNVEQILNYVYNWGIDHNVKTTKDPSGCVYYDVPATSGCENFPAIILQAHVDMVHTTEDPNIDMNSTPIDIVFDEEDNSLHSRDFKTNIGADDAEGMTALMIMSINKNFTHGPLRMLFTFDEETSMEGAINISPEVIQPNYLVNVDGGPVGSACVSSAGVFKVNITKDFQTKPKSLDTKLKISIRDLMGGHSGVDIAKNRMSANAAAVSTIKKAQDEGINFEVAEYTCGTTANVISITADYSIYVDHNDADKIKDIINEEFETQKKGKPDDKNAKISISEESATSGMALSIEDSKELIDFLEKLPQGCRQTDSQETDKPAVSSNIGISSLKDGHLDVIIHSRSNINGRNEELDDFLKQTCKDYSATYNVLTWYKAWERNEDTAINILWQKSYKDTCNIETYEYTTHGGLECSRFLEKNPNLKMLSVGMDVADEHMLTEKLYTKSIPVFYACLLNFLENANQL